MSTKSYYHLLRVYTANSIGLLSVVGIDVTFREKYKPSHIYFYNVYNIQP